MLWGDDWAKTLGVFVGMIFFAGVAVGVLLCKVIPWLMTHIRIEWVS